MRTGWKLNPVNFDSVFNQSFKTFSFGSPDILPMFAHGASDPDRVQMWMYDADAEDFGKDASSLDTWVFNHTEMLFQNATEDKKLYETLHSKNIVFFLQSVILILLEQSKYLTEFLLTQFTWVGYQRARF